MKNGTYKQHNKDLAIYPNGFLTRNEKPVPVLRIGPVVTGYTLDSANGFSYGNILVHRPYGKSFFGFRKSGLTNSSANSIVTIDIPVSFMAGGTIEWTIIAGDGTDVQSRTGITTFSGVNKASTLTTDVDEIGGSVSVSAGTLTGAWSLLNGTNAITLQFTPTSSLTPTTLELGFSIKSLTGARILQV